MRDRERRADRQRHRHTQRDRQTNKVCGMTELDQISCMNGKHLTLFTGVINANTLFI